jgi:aconitate hydratase
VIDVRRRLPLPFGASTTYFSLPQLETLGMGRVSRLPVSVRILLESVLRHVDGRRIRDEDVEALARWQPGAARAAEVQGPQSTSPHPSHGSMQTRKSTPSHRSASGQ